MSDKARKIQNVFLVVVWAIATTMIWKFFLGHLIPRTPMASDLVIKYWPVTMEVLPSCILALFLTGFLAEIIDKLLKAHPKG